MPEKKDEKVVDHSGHRQRMKQRYLANGLDGFSSHEIIELLLFYAVPYKDVNGLAHSLIQDFGGLTNLLEADYEDLVAHPGVTPHIAMLIGLTRDIGRHYQMELAGRVTQLCTAEDYARHLAPRFLGRKKETFLLLSMDNKCKLLNISQIQEGGNSTLPLNVRLAVQQALKDNATTAVLAHNHPSGYAFPSREDVEITRQLAEVLRQVDIKLLDHIIVAENECLSMAHLYMASGDFYKDIWAIELPPETV